MRSKAPIYAPAASPSSFLQSDKNQIVNHQEFKQNKIWFLLWFVRSTIILYTIAETKRRKPSKTHLVNFNSKMPHIQNFIHCVCSCTQQEQFDEPVAQIQPSLQSKHTLFITGVEHSIPSSNNSRTWPIQFSQIHHQMQIKQAFIFSI